MNDAVERLVGAASQSAAAGRWDEAERLWKEVAKLAPEHPQALYSLGVHALQRRDFSEARRRLTQGAVAAPNDPLILLTLSIACRDQGDSDAELQAIQGALAIDAYFLPALLAKAGWLERQTGAASAAATYANCLKIAPPAEHWPQSLRPQLEHAREIVERHAAAKQVFLAGRIADLIAALPTGGQGRWREAASLMSGRTKPFHAECNQLCVPRLPAIPFFDRADFAWAPALEAKTDQIRAELEGALAATREDFTPYIAYRPGDPVNQWRELNHSTRWSAYHLWRSGEPVVENMARCPETAAALKQVEMAELAGLCPNAMFSALAPKTRIPPHNGETNARLVVHLPLIVPDGCTYRVGFDERGWTVGEILVFDDTIEHEAWNGSDELRVVLIFDIWNPLLTPAERGIVQALTAAARAFSSQG